MMGKTVKTNAMRILDKAGISYEVHTYQADDGRIDGRSVAEKTGRPMGLLYKTLVAQGSGRDYYVFVVPVGQDLDLKRAAKSVGEKSVEMIPVKDINQVTGYIRGGCSPIGMKKAYWTVIDESCLALETLFVSGGKIGVQIELTPVDLIRAVGASVEKICRN